jgi:Xaa-Pro aminopeptidase
MKSDLDRLMADADLEALLVSGSAAGNPPMMYFTGRAHLTYADLLKKRGAEPVLFHRPMERDEATRTGLATRNMEDYGLASLLEQAHGDTNLARAMRFQRLFAEYGVNGRMAVAGRLDAGEVFGTFQHLARLAPGLDIVGEPLASSVLARARVTKDPTEIERIRQVGRITTGVVSDAANFLTSHRVRDGALVNNQGEVLTIGDVKRRINLWLAMRGADNPEGTIFAIGYDAAVPHSAGTDAQTVEIGKTIVFDLFPCEAGGGYFYDFTRTWCLGHAPEEVERIYRDVLEVRQEVEASFRPDTECRQYQKQVCEMFEARGHPTVLSDPRTTRGYVHRLSHGLGLDVQESPWFDTAESNTDRLVPGTVFTVEPGLYYPERELGVRLEDTCWMRPDGVVERLADFPMDLVLKMEGA